LLIKVTTFPSEKLKDPAFERGPDLFVNMGLRRIYLSLRKRLTE